MNRTLAVTATGLLTAATALVALTSPAGAAPRTTPGHGTVSHATGVDTRAEQDAVRAFWTPQRMRAAVPRGPQRPLAKPGGPGPGTTTTNLGTAWTAGRKTVGKVFFQLGSSLYVCSGNAVDDVDDGNVVTTNLVVTAGHCVNDGGNAFATNFMFIPAYISPRTSAQPYGSFTASRLYTTSQWADQTSDRFNYDVGMALVGGSDGGSVQLKSLVGASDIDSDIGFVTGAVNYTVKTHAFGYPAARPYDGTRLISCWGATTHDYVGGSSDYRLPCNMTGGSSGGPWLLDSTSAVAPLTENSDVSDVQISVNSFGYRGEKNAMYGPIFGTTIQNLYTTTAAAAAAGG